MRKSKTVAYLLWLFFGFLGAHKFYLGKGGMGILYLFTCGLFLIGWILDFFTLGAQVDLYNALYANGFGSSNINTNNIVVNIPGQIRNDSSSVAEQLHKLADLKERGVLTEAEFNTQKTKLLS